MTGDVLINETGNGGDFVLIGKTTQLAGGLQNMAYLGMYGGNPQQSTRPNKTPVQRFDWWGNDLFFPNAPDRQFNSLTEKTLSEITLNSAGRMKVEKAIKKDLEFMLAFCEIEVETSITGIYRLEMKLKIKRPSDLSNQIYIYLWDSFAATLTIVTQNGASGGDFNNDFSNDFNS